MTHPSPSELSTRTPGTADTHRSLQCATCARRYRVRAGLSLREVACPHCGTAPLRVADDDSAVPDPSDGPSRYELLKRPSTSRDLGVIDFLSGFVLLAGILVGAWYVLA